MVIQTIFFWKMHFSAELLSRHGDSSDYKCKISDLSWRPSSAQSTNIKLPLICRYSSAPRALYRVHFRLSQSCEVPKLYQMNSVLGKREVKEGFFNRRAISAIIMMFVPPPLTFIVTYLWCPLHIWLEVLPYRWMLVMHLQHGHCHASVVCSPPRAGDTASWALWTNTYIIRPPSDLHNLHVSLFWQPDWIAELDAPAPTDVDADACNCGTHHSLKWFTAIRSNTYHAMTVVQISRASCFLCHVACRWCSGIQRASDQHNLSHIAPILGGSYCCVNLQAGCLMAILPLVMFLSFQVRRFVTHFAYLELQWVL